MQQLHYDRPETLAEALALLARCGDTLRPLAGGTDLMVQLREGKQPYTRLMELSALKALYGITLHDGALSIGALTTHTELAGSALVRAHAPVLADAAASVGSPQIRNRATLGGNIVNRSAAADTPVPLVLMGAEAELMSLGGARRIPLSELLEQGRRPDELLTVVTVPSFAVWHTAFCKLGRRKALAVSRMSAAAALLTDGDTIQDARLACGAVFARPMRVEAAEVLLIGQRPDAALFDRCGASVAEEMRRLTGVRWSSDYKEPAVAALCARALAKAYEGTL